ncbi:unnamed protein product [Echinostoma caproni]|uniref:Rhodanese domain-containing protein n=1 Tax=Echinostoma caproni TaxID=27848 RepID=A0A183ASD3_9TREM|nr:unnamed protein product [Echinostoma caproni]
MALILIMSMVAHVILQTPHARRSKGPRLNPFMHWVMPTLTPEHDGCLSILYDMIRFLTSPTEANYHRLCSFLSKVHTINGRKQHTRVGRSLIGGVGEYDTYLKSQFPDRPLREGVVKPVVGGEQPYLLLDVRDRDEYDQCHIISGTFREAQEKGGQPQPETSTSTILRRIPTPTVYCSIGSRDMPNGIEDFLAEDIIKLNLQLEKGVGDSKFLFFDNS